MITIFIIINVQQFNKPEQFQDYMRMKNTFSSCNYSFQFIKDNGPKMIYLCFSKQLGEPRILPFIFSITILPSAFVLAKKLTGYKISGLISVLILITTPVVNEYSASAAYDQFWSLMLIWSVYFMIRKPILSIPMLIFAALSKPLALLYIPMIINTIKNDRKISILYLSIFILSISMWGFGFFNVLKIMWKPLGFLNGMAIWFVFLQHDYLILPIMPLVLADLISLHKKNVKYSGMVFWWIVGILISMPMLEGFTNMDNQPYRLVPLLIFYSIGLSMVILNFGKIHPIITRLLKQKLE